LAGESPVLFVGSFENPFGLLWADSDGESPVFFVSSFKTACGFFWEGSF
jgi:hypothetical protein